MEGLIRNAGKCALSPPGQHDVARNEKRILSAHVLVRRTGRVIVRAFDEIHMRPHGHSRSDKRAFGIEVDAAASIRIRLAVPRLG
jgi:hypothetical protein